MKIVDEKLKRFANDIMKEVQQQKKERLERIIEAHKVEYDKKHTQYLTENYEIIQESLKKIDKEKNEIMSKVIMDNKTKLLNKRTEVIGCVFELAKSKLYAHTQEESYLDELIQDIKNNIIAIGPGDLEIIISYSDQRLLNTLQEVFGPNIKLENKNIEMIGGSKVMNITGGLFIDDSYARRLEDQKEAFLKKCNIVVEMQ